jgi:hypothetical protein
MSSTDRSQTERIRRLRSQLQAVRRAECAACPELGPQGPTDQSTWLNRRFGQAPYLREAANGAIQTLSCCGTGPLVCDASTINFDDYIAFFSQVNPGNNTYSITFTIDGSFMTLITYRNREKIKTETLPIIYIQSDINLSGLEFDSTIYINNSANTINVSLNNTFLIQLTPCGAI